MAVTDLPVLEAHRQTSTAFAYGQLKRAILDGHLAPGARLREQELVDWLSVSRTPVREALRKLHAEGLVEILSYKGAMVRPLDADEVREEYILRAALEGMAAELAVQNLLPDDLQRLEELALHLEQALGAQNAEQYLKANFAFHSALYALSGSSSLMAGIDAAWEKDNMYRRVAYALPGGWDEELRFHRALIAACRSRDANEARRLVQRSCLDFSDMLILAIQAADSSPSPSSDA